MAISRPSILPASETLQLEVITCEADTVAVRVRACRVTVECPKCGRPTARIHSRYSRVVADLPWQGCRVQLQLTTRRWCCGNAACARRIFTERLPGVVARYARRTDRLSAWLTHVAFALGGEPGARLLRHSGVALSGDALLAHVRACRPRTTPAPRVLSVDDFAFRRGRTYGTILVDLERRRVVDLLPERSAATLAAWLQAHPEPEVISRDRGGEYADGARRGAPQATQVADRFHLLKNVGETAERVLRRHAPLVRQVPAPAGRRATPRRWAARGGAESPALRRPPVCVERPDRRAAHDRTTATLAERYAAVRAAAAAGLNASAIARAVGLHRHTVQKYLALQAAPERRRAWRPASQLAPYTGFVLERWRQGARQAMPLWRELVAQGYPGRYRQVARLVATLRRREHANAPLQAPPPGLTPRQAAGLLLTRPLERTPEEQATIQRVRALHTDLRTAVGLLDGFAHLIRDKTAATPARRRQHLEQWTDAAATSGLPEFAAFVTKLRQDTDAVVAALVLPYSQGQTEGQINRLKTIKRAMYGRANFDLLRQRVLYAAA